MNYSPARTEITCAIMLDTQTAAGAPARVRCSISDQGYGISAKQQAHLFERFQRFHTIDQPKAGGTGLGMAFVKTVVTRHGGDVQVNSQIGVGTIFTVRLPVLDEVTE